MQEWHTMLMLVSVGARWPRMVSIFCQACMYRPCSQRPQVGPRKHTASASSSQCLQHRFCLGCSHLTRLDDRSYCSPNTQMIGSGTADPGSFEGVLQASSRVNCPAALRPSLSRAPARPARLTIWSRILLSGILLVCVHTMCR